MDFFGDLIVGGGFWTIGSDSFVKIARVKSLGHFFQPASVKELAKDQDLLTISPKPASGKFAIKYESQLAIQTLEIIISDLLGREVWRKCYSAGSKQFLKTIELPESSKGLHILEVHTDNKRKRMRFVIK